MEYSLKFLFSRLHKEGMTIDQRKGIVCQEVFISKVSGTDFLNNKIVFKGGIVLNSMSHGERGYTKDIDFDFVKYPLSEEGINDFIIKLNETSVYPNIRVSLTSMKDLRQRNYFGKRVTLSFSDGIDEYPFVVDIGVYKSLLKRNRTYLCETNFGEKKKIIINSNERIIAEKLSTFAIYGTDNTRFKDLFDAYWLISNVKYDDKTISTMLKKINRRGHYYDDFNQFKKALKETLSNKKYVSTIEKLGRNWLNVSLKEVLSMVIYFLEHL